MMLSTLFWITAAGIVLIGVYAIYRTSRWAFKHYQLTKRQIPKQISETPGWRGWLPEISMGIFLLILGVWAFRATPVAPVANDYIALNRPYLVPQLVIDSLTNGLRYHYQVENTGILPASPITYQEQVEGAEMREGQGSRIARELVRGAPMMLHTPFGDGIIPLTSRGEARLILSYHARIAGKDESFQSLNRFSLSMPTAKPGDMFPPISPEVLDQAPPVNSDAPLSTVTISGIRVIGGTNIFNLKILGNTLSPGMAIEKWTPAGIADNNTTPDGTRLDAQFIVRVPDAKAFPIWLKAAMAPMPPAPPLPGEKSSIAPQSAPESAKTITRAKGSRTVSTFPIAYPAGYETQWVDIVTSTDLVNWTTVIHDAHGVSNTNSDVWITNSNGKGNQFLKPIIHQKP